MDKKQLEKNEIERLVRSGFEFEGEWDSFERRGVFGILGRKKVHHKQRFRIEEPTLGTLDRMSREFIEMDINAPEMDGMDSLMKAKYIVSKNAYRACRVVAIAVLGTRASRLEKYNKGISISESNKMIDELATVFMNIIKPSELVVITNAIIGTSNMVDFWSSIALMSVERTSKPTAIEE